MARSKFAPVFALVFVAAVLTAALPDVDMEDGEEVEDLQLLQTETVSVKLAESQSTEKPLEDCEEVPDLQLLQTETVSMKLVESESTEKPIAITGKALEPGGWGNSLYHHLKASGQPVRAIPATTFNIQEGLQCQACDETEGIFVVEVADQWLAEGQARFRRGLRDVKAVVVPAYMPHPLVTTIPNVVKVAAEESPSATFLMISEMNTTAVDDNAASNFDTLFWEAELITAGHPYAILKTCPREEGPAGKKELVVAPADENQLIAEFEGVQTGRFAGTRRISNADVARVVDFWANLPPPEKQVKDFSRTLRRGARIDLCAKDGGMPTADEALPDIMSKSWQPWQLVDYKEPTAETLEAAPILVTGATGRTGRLVYHELRSKNVPTRAFVRNRTKAREVLGCDACDESEGIFVGDVAKAESFMDAVWDIRGIIITTTSDMAHDGTGTDLIPETREIDMWGTYLQVFAAGEAAKKSGVRPFVFYVSWANLERKSPNQFLFNKLNGEVLSMSQGLPFAIVKPCKLNDNAGGHTEVLVGPSDSLGGIGGSEGSMSRADLAKLLVEMAMSGKAVGHANLRFDVCSRALASGGTTATNLSDQATLRDLLVNADIA